MSSVTNASRRARGLHRIEIWLEPDEFRKLEELCEDSGFTRADMIGAMIDGDYEEWQQLGRRRPRSRASSTAASTPKSG